MNVLESQRKIYPEYDKIIGDINLLLNELFDLKESRISAKGNPPMPLTVWKLKSYAQTSLHRTLDLTIESCKAWENEVPAVAFLLTRSVIETVAYIFDFSNQVKPLVDEGKFVEINDLINKLKYGEKIVPNLPAIDNVLTVMDRIKKIIPDFRKNYENISSFCHPNYSAIGMLYSLQDMEEYCFEIDKKYGVRKDFFSIIITFLYTSLELQKLSLNRLEIIYSELEKLDAKEYEKKGIK